MAITKDQAMTLGEVFAVTHEERLFSREDRKRGYKVFRYRRNGATQVWKTRPTEWRMPIKYGIRAHGQFSVTHEDADRLYATEAEAVAYGEEVLAGKRFFAALGASTMRRGEGMVEDDFVLICRECGEVHWLKGIAAATAFLLSGECDGPKHGKGSDA